MIRLFQLIIILTSLHHVSIAQSPGKAENGMIDLRGIDWEEVKSVNLDGQWKFFKDRLINPGGTSSEPSELIEVPGLWNDLHGKSFGMATYQLTMLTDKNTNYAIIMPVVATAYTAFINGKEIGGAGVTGNRDEHRPYYKYDLIDLIPPADTLNLVIHVSNFNHIKGGLWSTIKFGERGNIIHSYIRQTGIDFLIMGGILIMALYHLVLYILRRKNTSALYFSLFCLVIALRILVSGRFYLTNFTFFPWELILKVEYLTAHLGILTFYVFFKSLFNEVLNPRISKVIIALFIAWSVLDIILPVYWVTYLLNLTIVAVIAVSIYGIVGLFRAFRQKIRGTLFFSVGFLLLFASIIGEILYVLEIVEWGYLIPYGLLGFIFFEGLILAKRFVVSYEQQELLHKELSSLSEHQEEIIQERTQQIKKSNEFLKNSMEEINKQNLELKKVNDELDNFVYSVSHDLRAPISAALGLLDLGSRTDDISEIKSYNSMLEENMNRLNLFIGDILNYSRNSRLEHEPVEIDIKELINKIVEQYGFYEKADKVDISIDVQTDSKVYSDKLRLGIIFNNLISNAIKYADLYKEQSFLKISFKRENSHYIIEIVDNGIGVKQEHIEKVFNMFYRAVSGYSGSGLGLYITKETVERLSGEIEVKSEYGKGTEFTIRIPVSEK